MAKAKTIQDVYNKLLNNTDLHSVPELDGEILIWKLYKDAYIRAYCDDYDFFIEINSDSPLSGELTHWHPEEDEICNQLYTLGKKGNILVLKKVHSDYDIEYLGEADKYCFNKHKKLTQSKLIYLEQK